MYMYFVYGVDNLRGTYLFQFGW